VTVEDGGKEDGPELSAHAICSRNLASCLFTPVPATLFSHSRAASGYEDMAAGLYI
jgi:hypothetical protein